jgi:uncharacterized protein (TIGR02145 family)
MKTILRFQLGWAFSIMLLSTCIALSQTSSDVKIGKQVWMSKNLDVSTFRNGDEIPQAKSKEDWVNAGENKQPAWCYYNFEENNGKKYGKLYNLYAAQDERILAPKGWYVPADEDWKELIEFLGGKKTAGNGLKSKEGWEPDNKGGVSQCTACKDWNSKKREIEKCQVCKNAIIVKLPDNYVSGGGDNSSGFTALPGGMCKPKGEFKDIGEDAYFWTRTLDKRNNGICFQLKNYNTKVDRDDEESNYGFSVRCIKY